MHESSLRQVCLDLINGVLRKVYRYHFSKYTLIFIRFLLEFAYRPVG